MFNEINGFEVIEDHYMVEISGYATVSRSLKERLFTLPWKPLQRTKEMPIYTYMNKVIRMGNKLVMHPDMKKALVDEIENRKNDGGH